MRAVVYDGYGRFPRIREVTDPVAPDGGVVVRVSATGVCRSDWHAWMGHDPVNLPQVPGHELVGTIESVGSGVRDWQVGDRVTVPFVCGCGRCEVCLQGDPQVCPDQTQPGFTGWGSFAELVALHSADTNLVAVPDDIGDVEAAALGCRFATAYRAITAHGGIAPASGSDDAASLAVFGAGGVGLSAVLIGVALGARVVAVDVSEAALETASRCGAHETVLVGGLSPKKLARRVRELTGGGAHVGIDAIGQPRVAVASVLSLRRRGRHVQAGLLLGENADTPLPMDRVIAYELSIHGTHGLAAADYPAMLDLVSRSVDLSALVGQVIRFVDAPAALAGMSEPASGQSGITVVDMSI